MAELYKKLALLKHLDVEYFEHEYAYYIGKKANSMQEYREHMKELLSDKGASFQDWLIHYGTDVDEEIKDERVYQDGYTYNNKCYLVLTDKEADEKYEEYIEDSILELYCDNQWIKSFVQCRVMDEAIEYYKENSCRANELASYDGCENTEDIDDETFYIYRTN